MQGRLAPRATHFTGYSEHIKRGFTVKNKADQPTEQELKSAVGFKGSVASNKAAGKVATIPEEKNPKRLSNSI